MLLALKQQSLHGATKSPEESRLWMIHHLTHWDTWFYAVFLREPESATAFDPDSPGMLLGSVALRRVDKGPELLPPPSFKGMEEVGRGQTLGREEEEAREEYWAERDLDLRVLGYAFFAAAHGKGYATEACRGLLDEYAERVREWRGSVDSERVFYVEAGVDQENPGSQNVLRKLGLRTVGLKIEKEKAWLNGAWRGPGWWITGMYV